VVIAAATERTAKSMDPRRRSFQNEFVTRSLVASGRQENLGHHLVRPLGEVVDAIVAVEVGHPHRPLALGGDQPHPGAQGRQDGTESDAEWAQQRAELGATQQISPSAFMQQ
jgi:hypothetical protein